MKPTLTTIAITLVILYFVIAMYGKYHISNNNITIIEITEIRPNLFVVYAMDNKNEDRFYIADNEIVLELVDANKETTDKILMSIDMTKIK